MVPDLVFVAREHQDILGEANIEGSPDLVVEIVSPSTRRNDLLTKRALYARIGVCEYWLVEPVTQTVTVLALEAGRYIARGVYVGARQAASGGGAQATLQIDIAKGLKAEATAGSGQTTATGATSNTDAATVGLRYQFEY